MIISEKIFKVLAEKNISQKSFSQQTGISQSTISDWKRKKTNPAADKILVICNALKISVYELLEGTDMGTKKTLDYIIVEKDSQEYMLLENYQKLDKNAKERVLGYMDALMENI